MVEHYFRVSNIPMKQKSFISSFLSNLSVTGWLILVNVLLFVLTLVFSSFIDVNKYFALQANNLFNNYYFWTLLTSMFMHAGPFHLFVNMLSLFFIGKFLETILGKKRYFWLYILAGVFASLFFAFFSYFFGVSGIGARIFATPDTFAVGASGAIFAIAGVLALLTPRNKVYLIAGPLIAIILQSVIGNFINSNSVLNIINILITIYIFICIFSMFSFNGASKISVPIQMSFWLLPVIAIVPLIFIGLFISLPIGNMAHLGGYIAGACYGIYLRMKYPNKTRILARSFS